MDVPPGVDRCSIPAERAPVGAWDFVHFESFTTTSIVVCIVSTVIALLVAGPRIHVNRKRLGLADYSTILAFIFGIPSTALIIKESPIYRHNWNIPACWFDNSFIKITFCLVFLAAFSQFFSRAAIFLLYRELFKVHNRAVHVAIWTGLMGTFLINAANISVAIAILAPHLDESWDDALKRLSVLSNEFDFSLWGPILSTITVIFDILAFVLPIPIIIRLNLSFRRRLQFLLLFSTALVGVAASIATLVYKVQPVVFRVERRSDQGLLLGLAGTFATVENNVAIIVGSMPAFARFMRVHILNSETFRGWKSRFGGRYSGRQGSSKNGPLAPLHGTIDSPSPRKKARPPYYELNDTEVLRSAYVGTVESRPDAPVEPSHIGILRITDVRRESQ
ncbi:hypothetical protein F4777DRAFT_599844 [Nemania sp. FL0916]|nr:hypothetical protein F4777DRAFT_599844 [Nemania sp. FL0916]